MASFPVKKYDDFELSSENKPEYDAREEKEYTRDYVFDSYEKIYLKEMYNELQNKKKKKNDKS